MKKVFLIVAISILTVSFGIAEELSMKAQFIKANLVEKTALVEKSAEKSSQNIAELGIAFVVENKEFLTNDKDLKLLALASVEALPKEKVTDENPYLLDSLVAIFDTFDDEKLKITIMEKIAGDENHIKRSESVVSFINSYLKKSIDRKERVSDVTKAALKTAAIIGNNETFKIVFNGWKMQIWRLYQEVAEDTLGVLASFNLSDAVKVFAMSNTRDDLEFFEIIEKNSKISQEFKAEVSENALSDAILSIENFEIISKDQIALQQKTLKVIADAKWTRASALVLRTFEIAKDEYIRKIITAEQLVNVIESTAALASPDTALHFSKYLETLNAGMEKGNPPEKAVVLSIIKSLGGLGDKIAFDSLLYVTYLPYPEEVIVETRNSLAKLKW